MDSDSRHRKIVEVDSNLKGVQSDYNFLETLTRNFVEILCGQRLDGLYEITGIHLKGQSHEKVDELRVWGVSLGPN
jgi:hypothetical protein